MQYIEKKGHSVPVIGLGTWQLTGEECSKAVEVAKDAGYTHIDTAQIYGNEAEVGIGIKDAGYDRDELFLTTKVWEDNFKAGKVADSVEESLTKLKVDYVDLLLVHWPFQGLSIEELVTPMMEMKEAGKTKLIGISNFTVSQIEEAQKIAGGELVCNQVEYHPYLNQDKVLKAAHDSGMFLTAYSPIARGNIIEDETLMGIANAHNKNTVQIALRWLTQQEGVVAIPKSGTEKNIKSNIDIFDIELSDEEMAMISALSMKGQRLVDPGFAPEWDQAEAA